MQSVKLMVRCKEIHGLTAPALVLIMLSLVMAIGACQTVHPPPTVANTAAPTATTPPTPNIDATVEARLQATIAAIPTATPPPTPTLLPTSNMAPTPTLGPTSTPTQQSLAADLDIDRSPENLPLILLAGSNPKLAQRIAGLPWVSDGVNNQESLVLSRLRTLAAKDPELTNELIKMPFLALFADANDAAAITSLEELSLDFPEQLQFLRGQEWFADGLKDSEASYLVVLVTHALLQAVTLYGPNDFQQLAAQNYGGDAETKSISLPLGGEIELISFNDANSHTDAEEILEDLEAMILAMEKFMDIPFPTTRVLVLFVNPPESRISFSETQALNVGTHMIIRPDLPAPTLKRALIHELAHYYWHGSGQTGLPPWFAEGAPEFLATRLLKPNPAQAVADRWYKLNSRVVIGTDQSGDVYTSNVFVEACRNYLNVKNIKRLNERIADQGYGIYSGNPAFGCNYVFGETLLIALNRPIGIGNEPFRAAWKDIYELFRSVDRLVTEEEIYEAFLRHTPEDKIVKLEGAYEEWHGFDLPR